MYADSKLTRGGDYEYSLHQLTELEANIIIAALEWYFTEQVSSNDNEKTAISITNKLHTEVLLAQKLV